MSLRMHRRPADLKVRDDGPRSIRRRTGRACVTQSTGVIGRRVAGAVHARARATQAQLLQQDTREHGQREV